MEILPRSAVLRGLLTAFLFAAPLGAAGLGDPAPPIAFPEFTTGKAFQLTMCRGGLVLVDFWASWCAPCRRSFPHLQDLQNRYGVQGLQVVGVSLDEEPNAVRAFLESTSVTFRILQDPSGKSAEAYGVVAMPTSFLVDREGRIVARFEGGERFKEEEAAIQTLLGGGRLTSEVRVSRGLTSGAEISRGPFFEVLDSNGPTSGGRI